MNCPICLLDLTQPIPPFCRICAWDLKNDLTLNTFLSPILESEFDIYRNRVELARQNWEHLQMMKKEYVDKTACQENYGQSTQAVQERIINEKDGTLLSLIPEGEFLAGGSGKDEGGGEPFPVWLSAYYLALYPVTNIQYAQFLIQVQPSEGDLKKWVLLDLDCFVRKAGNRYEAYGNKSDHPVVNVSWYGAKAYGEWAGLRLPSELEWEKGARGVDGREYPWGSIWDKSKCRNRENRKTEKTCSVQSYPEGRSPWGLYQMSGNICEWCEDRFDTDAYKRYQQGTVSSPPEGVNRVLRGGSWFSLNPMRFRGASRSRVAPVSRLDRNGFRLARTVSL